MKLLVWALMTYLAIRLGEPAALSIWNDVLHTQERLYEASLPPSVSSNHFCLSLIYDVPQDQVVLQVSKWVYTIRHLYQTLKTSQLQLLKLLFSLLTITVPSLPFKLSVASGLLCYKWVELNLDTGYAIEILVLIAAASMTILRARN